MQGMVVVDFVVPSKAGVITLIVKSCRSEQADTYAVVAEHKG